MKTKITEQLIVFARAFKWKIKALFIMAQAKQSQVHHRIVCQEIDGLTVALECLKAGGAPLAYQIEKYNSGVFVRDW